MQSVNGLVLANFIFLFITLSTLIVVILDRFSWKQYLDKRNEPDYFVTLSYEILPVMLIIMVIRTYIYEPFTIPSESMYPQLTQGDVIVVSKSSYSLKFPFTNFPLVNLNSPKQGEVAVFKYPLDQNSYFIKRVIGTPGDKLVWEGDDFFINGKKVQREATVPNAAPIYAYGDRYTWEMIGDRKYQIRRISNDDSSRFAETSTFLILKTKNDKWSEVAGYKNERLEVTVPQGHYFVMGDNRDMSLDSRVWGFVDERLFVGKAKYLILHIDPKQPIWRLWEKIKFKRNKVIQ